MSYQEYKQQHKNELTSNQNKSKKLKSLAYFVFEEKVGNISNIVM